jgi:hypothetical protein
MVVLIHNAFVPICLTAASSCEVTKYLYFTVIRPRRPLVITSKKQVVLKGVKILLRPEMCERLFLSYPVVLLYLTFPVPDIYVNIPPIRNFRSRVTQHSLSRSRVTQHSLSYNSLLSCLNMCTKLTVFFLTYRTVTDSGNVIKLYLARLATSSKPTFMVGPP